MRSIATKIGLPAILLAAGLAVAPAIQSQAAEEGGMMDGMGQMQMGQMKDHCSQMMQGGGAGTPNEQWRDKAPDAEKS